MLYYIFYLNTYIYQIENEIVNNLVQFANIECFIPIYQHGAKEDK